MTAFDDWVYPTGQPIRAAEPLDDNPTCRSCGHKATPHHHFATPVICLLCPKGICQDGPDGSAYRNSLTARDKGPVGRVHEDRKPSGE